MRYRRGTGPPVLVVDPDAQAGDFLVNLLEDDGYRVARARSGRQAYDLVHGDRPELIILDLLLPDADGLALYVDLKMLTGAPVIVCSATKRRRDRPLSLKLGVDDFVAKPFDWEDLKGRIEATLRRPPAQIPSVVLPDTSGATDPADRPGVPARVGPTERAAPNGRTHLAPPPGAPHLERVRNGTLVAGRNLALTATEHRLLSALLERPGEYIARDELALTVWGYDDDGIAQAISVHMHRLRRKLAGSEWRGTGPPSIRSMRGLGYAFIPERPGSPPDARSLRAS